MRFEFEHLGSLTPFELAEGQHLLGGGPEDPIRLEGLPPGLLTLHIEGPRLTVTALQPITVNGVLVPSGLRRLVLPGEVMGLPQEMRLKAVAPPPEAERPLSTVAVLKHLLTDAEELPPSQAATLTCLTGLDTGRVFPLAGARTDIGRGTGVDLHIRDRTVSRAHARLCWDGTTYTVASLSPHNSLYVNGRKVRQPLALGRGDVIELGQTLLRFQAAVEAPLPEAPLDAGEPPAPELDAAQQSRFRGEGWFLGMGAVMALTGILVTYALLG
ncbi:Inner membrane component of T3SS domain-containing protein [Stigmatella aurantiaca]|uniref:Inner membrane component of T3SS domain-containing protein n=1 Tax=Stigmatella aurantiaca TaxID=41 RepID=A0A1H7UJ62_STIAU|nr:FHA domain-containing protein [Stigmatella aurantiaca]SEL96784.1 Inner membrane component of T3SS domain-containing protein [Stigmatella aurantiaca]